MTTSDVTFMQDSSVPLQDTAVNLEREQNSEATFQEQDLEEANDASDTVDNASVWYLFGYEAPRTEIKYFGQIIMLYFVIISCVTCLAMGHPNSNLWTALLSSSLGILLPSPALDHSDRISNNKGKENSTIN